MLPAAFCDRSSGSLLAELVGDHEDATGEQRQGADHGAGVDFRSGAAAAATRAAAGRLGVSHSRTRREYQSQTRDFDRFGRKTIDELHVIRPFSPLTKNG